jgi:peroxisomal coenzyme A diphosphatase NUDT7
MLRGELMVDDDFYKQLWQMLSERTPVVKSEVDDRGSAVLLPLVEVDGELAILFEVRAAKLSWQPGEICLPGGRIEASDANPLEAAVRETVEELGVTGNCIQVLGALDYIASPIGVTLYPYAAVLSDHSHLRPNSDEVAEVFTVPLQFLLQAEPLTAEMEMATRPLGEFPADLLPHGYSVEWKRRRTYQVYFYCYEKYVIWGLTAQVIRNFLNICVK